MRLVRQDASKPSVSWWLAAAGSLAAVSTMNAVIYVFGWSDRAGDDPASPPGWVFFAVWSGLFLLMGTSYWKLSRLSAPAAAQGRTLVLWLFVACLSYPLYTVGLSSDLLGFIGNVCIAVLAIVAFERIIRVNWLAAAALIPLIGWLAFATMLTARGLDW